MNEKEFFKTLKGKRVAFIGAGVSHKDCIKLFAKRGAIVTLCDKKDSIEAFGEYAEVLQKYSITLSLGAHYLDGLQNQDMILRTPGFEYFTPELVAAKESGCTVTSEMELFFELCPCKIIAVTGSDGKTTTTTLIAEMLKQAGHTVHLGGNLGRALLPIVAHIQKEDIAVVELSSFQLISMRRSPDIAVVTNVTPNHLDHHKDMQEYIDAKRNILLYQMQNSKTVLGYENEITRGMQSDVKGRLQWFTRFSVVEDGAFIREDGMLCMAQNGSITPVVRKETVALRGEHNLENVLAAIATVWELVSVEQIAKVAKTFCGVEHRIEPVRTLNGVQWFNDSIATSPTRVIAGLRAFSQKLILIAGGSDKGISFAPLAPELIAHVKVLILTGATADKIEAAVSADVNFTQSGMEIMRADSMEQAVNLAYEMAKEGDIVSLSPACASFDCYANFEARGKHYKDLVNAL